MSRTSVVTGAASGIGLATRHRLEASGHRVIGVDLAGSDISVDLATADGRRRLVGEVGARTGGTVDSVFAVAGSSQLTVAGAAVNYFGAVGTLEGLRPMLAQSDAPRAVAVSSMAAIFETDDDLLVAMLDGDESTALARAAELAEDRRRAHLIYGSSKRALSRWVRRCAPSADWAGASIALNAVAPGIIATPMSAPHISSAEGAAAMLRTMPMPLNGIAPAEAVADLLVWLGSTENSHLCGQVIYADGGSDAVIRGDATW